MGKRRAQEYLWPFRVSLTDQGNNLEIGAAQPVPIPSEVFTPNGALLTLAPDGKRLLGGVPLSTGAASTLTLVHHWADELD